MNTSRTSFRLEPPNGWKSFEQTESLEEYIWEQLRDGLKSGRWKYTNFTSDSSIWWLEESTIALFFEPECTHDNVAEFVINIHEKENGTNEIHRLAETIELMFELKRIAF